MRYYFHKYPTCPCCHEPHLNGSIIKVIDYDRSILKCSGCKAYFYKNIDFTHFKKTWNVMKGGNPEYNKFIKEVPLLWGFYPNIIEKAYLDWLNVDTSGKYLITWPWKEVKFIPILISNLALENPENKIAVISNFKNSTSTDDDEFLKPEFNLIFDNLFCCNSLAEIDEELMDDFGEFSRKNVLQRREKISYHIKIVKQLNDSETDFEVDRSVDAKNCSYTKCRNRLKKRLDRVYGENSVKLFKWKDRDIWQKTPPDKINYDGYFEISLEKHPEWGGELRYDKLGYWKVLSNINELFRVNQRISSIKILDENLSDRNIKNNQIFFISDHINPDQLFSLIKKINPKIVMFPEVDSFIEDKFIFNGQKGKEFIKFLDNTKKTVLMFSVTPDSRHLYKIGLNDGFIDKYKITPHTWDSSPLIEKLTNKDHNSKSASATSSSFNEIKINNEINARYILLKCLDTIEEFISKIFQVMDNTRPIKKFLNDLIKTPLYINDYSTYTNFSRGNLTFDYIMGDISETDYNTFKELIKPFNRYYLKDGKPSNPIMEKIIELLTDFIKKDNNVVFIVVPYYDKKGTEEILIQKGFQGNIPDQVRICTWKDLSSFDVESEPSNKFYVISTNYPYITYRLNDSNIKNFIFIGSSQNIEKIKIILKNRLDEKNKKPLYIPSLSEDCPELLRNSLNELHNVEKINNIISKLKFEENVELSGEERIIETPEESGTHRMKMHAGEEVIIVVDKKGNGLFLPLDRTISFKNKYDDSIDDIKTLKSKINDLKGREIIIDDHGFYTSYKLIFTKLMVEMGGNRLIKTPLYTWNGFKDLIYNATEWMRLLRKSLIRIQKDKKISKNDAKDELARILVNLNIHASNHSYIKNFWLAEPSIITTSHGDIQIFEIEHPRGFDDLIEIYEKLNELVPDIKLEPNDARRSYTAAITLQNIRKKFRKSLSSKDIPPEYRHLYEKLHEKIRMIVKKSAKFKIESVTTVKLSKDVYPFRILQNYQEYY